MAKFGVFAMDGARPLQVCEGDYMEHLGEYVTVKKNSGNPSVADRHVGAFRLDKGQCVKEITDSAQARGV